MKAKWSSPLTVNQGTSEFESRHAPQLVTPDSTTVVRLVETQKMAVQVRFGGLADRMGCAASRWRRASAHLLPAPGR